MTFFYNFKPHSLFNEKMNFPAKKTPDQWYYVGSKNLSNRTSLGDINNNPSIAYLKQMVILGSFPLLTHIDYLHKVTLNVTHCP